MNNKQNEEQLENLVTLIDEKNIEREFEILDIIELKGEKFYALLPNFEIPEITKNDNEDIYFLFKVTKINDVEQLEEVSDDKLLDELSEILNNRIEEIVKE